MRMDAHARLLFGLMLLCGIAHASSNIFIAPQDRAWKHYTSKQAGYCVSYPSRWVKAVGYEGAELSVITGVTRHSMPIASLDVAAVRDTVQLQQSSTPVSLSDDYQTHLTGLKQFIRAEGIETLEEKRLAVSGLDALFARARYYDPKEKSAWIEEIVFTHREGVTYRLELQAKATEWERFQPVFQRFVSSFQVECGR